MTTYFVDLPKEEYNTVTVVINEGKTSEFQRILKHGQKVTDKRVFDAYPEYFTVYEGVTFAERVILLLRNAYAFVTDAGFMNILALVMIAITAISFDIDGWKETYNRFDPYVVTFMIVSFYFAKFAIVTILASDLNTNRVQGLWNTVSYSINHYLLKGIFTIALISMVYVSFIGIYSSLAVNTTGDIKEISTINEKIQRTKNRLPDIETNIQEAERARDSFPENYRTAKRNMNKNIQKLYTAKSKLLDSIADLVDLKEKKLNENANKAINYSAELLEVSALKLLKFINLIIAWTLEITYLALTWHFVRQRN